MNVPRWRDEIKHRETNLSPGVMSKRPFHDMYSPIFAAMNSPTEKTLQFRLDCQQVFQPGLVRRGLRSFEAFLARNVAMPLKKIRIFAEGDPDVCRRSVA